MAGRSKLESVKLDYMLMISEYLESFQNVLNGRHVNMSFTIENEKQNRMSFLDV